MTKMTHPSDHQTPKKSRMPLPELLAPAGSPEALEAALAAGADAVYLGGSTFNARLNAHNFAPDELGAAVAAAHHVGARVYLTLNTLVYDRECAAALKAAYQAAVSGVDGLIVADIGIAALIHRALPSLPLHASTQLSGHSCDVGAFLAKRGFSRYVIARESSLEDLRTAVERSGLEVEVFIHGALCVSHSGQCLFSSLVGGRSGNRGECAQPCRLPYRLSCGKAKKSEAYPLSLKDLSLACHVPTLMDVGVASLKIEGRMKSPAYVGGVTAVWRRLLDEHRSATADEMAALSDLFSREGFTDGYFKGHVTHAMMGVRSQEDKARTTVAEKAALPQTTVGLPMAMEVSVRAGEPMKVTASAPLFRQGEQEMITCSVTGDIPAMAQNPSMAMSYDILRKQFSRMGGTPYILADFRAEVGEGLILPLSKLNALRRLAVETLDKARAAHMPMSAEPYDPKARQRAAEHPLVVLASTGGVVRTARMYRPTQVTFEAERFFDILYLPLFHWEPVKAEVGTRAARGVILPPVIFDREREKVRSLLIYALQTGAKHLLVGNVGHLCLAREAIEMAGADSVSLHGDFRLNATNATSVEELLSEGMSDVLLSPELTLPRLRDLFDTHIGRVGVIVYGRLPLMLLEKCAIREVYGTSADHAAPCGQAGEACRRCAQDAAVMMDRRGAAFPLLREFDHRNTVLNSLPLSMTDRSEELSRAHICHQHFMFTIESASLVNDVIYAAENGRSVGGEARRIVRQ